MSFPRGALIAPPILLGVALLWFADANRPPPDTAALEERRTPAAFVVATPRRFTPSVSGFGAVAPARVWSAVAQVSGRVAEIHPDFVRGGFVPEGQVLIRISAEDYELAVARAEADIRSAEARIEEMEISAQTTQASLAIEQEALALAERDLARVSDLERRGAVSSATVEDQERDVLAQRAKVASLQSTLQMAPAQLEALEQAAEVSRAAKRTAELDLERTEIAAPFPARVAAADVEVSQFVGVGAVMGALDGAEAAEIDVQMAPRLMAALGRFAMTGGGGGFGGVGAGATFADAGAALTARVGLGVEGADAAWPAQVARISDAVDPETRSIGVIVRVADPYAGAVPGERPPLIKGMFVRVTLSAPPVDGAILLPRSAIRDGRVRIADAQDRLAYVEVETFFSAGGIVVLAEGALQEGARVIVSDPSPAIEGLLLAPEPDPQAEARLDAAATEGAP
ncbi:MAG: TolC family protein [Pseudomonadota bacterium]